MKKDKLISLYREVLKELGIDLQDANYIETPERVARMMRHFFRNDKKEVVADITRKVFPSENDQMVIVKNIECFGMCPHHLVPVVYKVAIGYIPNGKVIGLSKLARLAIAVCSIPKLQEDVTKEIADELENILETNGVMVVMNGQHGCMRCRGIEMNAYCVTSDCRGVFRTKPEARIEFLDLIKE